MNESNFQKSEKQKILANKIKKDSEMKKILNDLLEEMKKGYSKILFKSTLFEGIYMSGWVFGRFFQYPFVKISDKKKGFIAEYCGLRYFIYHTSNSLIARKQ